MEKKIPHRSIKRKFKKCISLFLLLKCLAPNIIQLVFGKHLKMAPENSKIEKQLETGL